MDGEPHSPISSSSGSSVDGSSLLSHSSSSHLPSMTIPKPVSEVLKVVYQTKCALLRVSSLGLKSSDLFVLSSFQVHDSIFKFVILSVSQTVHGTRFLTLFLVIFSRLSCYGIVTGESSQNIPLDGFI